MPYATPLAGAIPAVPGILTEAEIRATGEIIAAGQQESGAIGWPDGLVDAWNHVECAMALTVCGLRGPARRAYDWLLATQRADGSWPRRTAPSGHASDEAGVARSPRSVSGAMQGGVPAASCSSGALARVTRPKSSSTTRPPSSRITFPVFTSRWTRPASCTTASAELSSFFTSRAWLRNRRR